jgi:predicted DNA-binding protein
MMTEQDVKKDINQKKENWLKEHFKGEIPSWLIKQFGEAVFVAPPNLLQLKVTKIREIMKKSIDQLNNFEIGVMTNLIASTPLYLLHENIEIALENQEVLSEFMNRYNEVVNGKEKEWSREYNSKMKILRPAGRDVPNVIIK